MTAAGSRNKSKIKEIVLESRLQIQDLSDTTHLDGEDGVTPAQAVEDLPGGKEGVTMSRDEVCAEVL